MVETQNYIYIFEFKRDGSAEEALKQIEDMGYVRDICSRWQKDLSDRLQLLIEDGNH